MKRLVMTAALVVAATVTPAAAQQYGSTYDWRSGNFYSWSPNGSGGTSVRGMNIQNGTNWNTNIKPDGSMSGFDGGGNYWQYNSNTGYYNNLGTGRTCVGKGLGRTCF